MLSLKTLVLATTCLYATSTSAWAQEATSTGDETNTRQIETIIVTAQKREQNQIDVPINISVLGGARVDRLNLDELDRLADFVPGLEVQLQSLNAPSFALRGITSDGGRSRVALFQNGVAISNVRSGQSMAIHDMERVEIVKGPQATLFGQGALVGGINFIQNRASLRGNTGELKIEGGSYNATKAQFIGNVAVNDTFAVRGAVLLSARDGYVENLGNSPDLMGQDTNALRLAARWTPNDNLRIDLILNGQQDDSTGTQFKSSVFPPAGGDLSPFTPTAMNINGDQLRSKLGNDRDIGTATAIVSYQLGKNWTLNSITDSRNIVSLEAFDSDGTELNLLQFGLVDKATAFSQELRLNYNAEGRLSGFFGVNYYKESTSQLLRFSTDEAHLQALFATTIAGAARLSVAQIEGILALRGIPNAANFDNVVNPLRVSALGALQGNIIPLNPAHLEQSYGTTATETRDLFADITYKFNDKLSLTAGVRYTEEDLEATSRASLMRGNPALGGRSNGVFFNQVFLSSQPVGVLRAREVSSDGAYTWRLNAAYRLSDDVNTWLAYGRGRRPEALSSSTAHPTGFVVVTEELYDHVETGLTGFFFDRSVRVTSSLYYGEYTDFQTSRFSPTLGTFITENSGNATQYGFEFEGQWNLSPTAQLFGSYAYNFSQYDDTDSAGNRLQFAGNSFRLSPEHNASIGLDWRFPMADKGEYYIIPSYTWKSEHFFEDDNDPREKQEAYGVADVRFGYEPTSKKWTANLSVQNAFDEEYLIDAGNTGGAFGILTYIRGMPRMVTAGVAVKF
ncbi:CirA Outer membrane receptor proteins, mostly Fe transport [Caulobacteraceae bacterium]